MSQRPPSTDLLFVPAATINEAAARLFSLTGRADPGTRGPKRALEALARSLHLDVDLAVTNAVLGQQIAEALEITWYRSVDSRGLQISLHGLNKILRAATENLWRLSRSPSVLDISTAHEVLRAFPAFQPARSKQEAVNRLSDVAGAPRDTLGPGGKEHRITFEHLARRVAPDLLAPGRGPASKHAMVQTLCERLDVPWIASAASTGQSVTLEGLNLLPAGAERRLGLTSAGWQTAEEEGGALTRVLRRGLPEHWDGRATVEEMHSSGSRNWRQMEWPGFYFEEQVGALLNEVYPTPPVGGPRRLYGATAFDYASPTRVWDAKAHTVLEVLNPSGKRTSKHTSPAILNDSDAVTSCVQEQGLGFLILDGAATFDETGTFDTWHRSVTTSPASRRTSSSNSGRSRRRKAAFAPTTLSALWIADLDALNAGIAGGWISQQRQGAQAVRLGQERGAPRNDKFHLKVHKAAPWLVAEQTWAANV